MSKMKLARFHQRRSSPLTIGKLMSLPQEQLDDLPEFHKAASR
jgi:hypothetical protein